MRAHLRIHLPEGSDTAAVIEAIIALGQALDLQIIAEGVETELQRKFLDGEMPETVATFSLSALFS